jgi:hypothetical protein
MPMITALPREEKQQLLQLLEEQLNQEMGNYDHLLGLVPIGSKIELQSPFSVVASADVINELLNESKRLQ